MSTYTYKRYMRDGSVKTITALVRSKTANRKNKKTNKKHPKEQPK